MKRSDLTHHKYPITYTVQPDGWIVGKMNDTVVLTNGVKDRQNFLEALGQKDAETLLATGTITLDKVAPVV